MVLVQVVHLHSTQPCHVQNVENDGWFLSPVTLQSVVFFPAQCTSVQAQHTKYQWMYYHSLVFISYILLQNISVYNATTDFLSIYKTSMDVMPQECLFHIYFTKYQ